MSLSIIIRLILEVGMGYSPNSYLGYGIAWTDDELMELEQEFDMHNIMEKLESHPEIQAVNWAHECTPCLFLYMGGDFS